MDPDVVKHCRLSITLSSTNHGAKDIVTLAE